MRVFLALAVVVASEAVPVHHAARVRSDISDAPAVPAVPIAYSAFVVQVFFPVRLLKPSDAFLVHQDNDVMLARTGRNTTTGKARRTGKGSLQSTTISP